MKFFTGSLLTIYGIYVFAGQGWAIGSGVLWTLYTGLSFLNGDMKIMNWEVIIPESRVQTAEQDQLDGLA